MMQTPPPPPPTEHKIDIAPKQLKHFYKQIHCLKFSHWDQQQEIFFFKDQNTEQVYRSSAKNLYVADFDALRNALVFLGELPTQSDFIRRKILSSGIAFLKPDERLLNFSTDADISAEKNAYQIKAGLWKPSFIKRFKDSSIRNTTKSISRQFDEMILSERLEERNFFDVHKKLFADIDSLKKDISVVKEKLNKAKPQIKSGSLKSWFENLSGNYLGLISVLIAVLGMDLQRRQKKAGKKVDEAYLDKIAALEGRILVLELEKRMAQLEKEANLAVRNRMSARAYRF